MKEKMAILMAAAAIMSLILIGADYNQSEDFGVKQPGDNVGFTATPPGTVVSGAVTNPGSFVWVGSLATWNGTIPDDFSGMHNGLFDGEYTVSGTGQGVLTWQVDTSAQVPTVEITQSDEKMLVEGEFDLTAEGNPADEDTYAWSFTGTGGGTFNPNPSNDGNTQFKTDEITSPVSKSFINVKYSVANDEKEAQITRCEYFKMDTKNQELIAADEKSPNRFTHLSNIFSSTNILDEIVAFDAIFYYDLYDQYRENLKNSEKGGSSPYVKEKYMMTTYRAFLIPHKITEYWKKAENCWIDDHIIFNKLHFYDLDNENYVENFRPALRSLVRWEASVQGGMHNIDTVEHSLNSHFIDVERGKNNELLNFRLQTEYIRVGALIQ
jgi:hypothetical protein